MTNFLSFERTWAFNKMIHSRDSITGLFYGNQGGKTAGVAYQYVMRIMGIHPVPERNVLYFECATRHCRNGHGHNGVPKDKTCQECGSKVGKFTAHTYNILTVPKSNICHCGTKITPHKRETRIFRFCSQTLPYEKSDTGAGGQSAEIKNTVYPAFKKWLPREMIKRDITFRNPSLVIHDPFGIADVIVEFVGYMQPGDGAGVQRLSVWEDEEAPYEFHKEQIPRLVAENGDCIISLTPANAMSWTYDEIYEKARVYHRTKSLCDFTGQQFYEETVSPSSITVIQTSTYDNPTLDEDAIETMRSSYDDPDDIATRLYGVHKQSSGRIFGMMNFKKHLIAEKDYFDDGIPYEWLHCRAVDYHELTPWAISFVALSPNNEMFIYKEYAPSPEKIVTLEINMEMAKMSQDYKYGFNLIDPLACKIQTNTGLSVMDDFNRNFSNFRRDGLSMGGYWESWDTKSTRGRDMLRERLKNSLLCDRPFNNARRENGVTKYLPTAWVINSCLKTARSLKQWRKDSNGKPEQKYSHFCTALEAILKDLRFRPKRGVWENTPRAKRSYFQGVQ
ncbi:MAG: terminase large subunit domain-containing protein [Candidatus Dojkabacteria bacterium]